jgi:hypothetical protein
MTARFLQQVEEAVRSGLSVAAIGRKYGFPNRTVRRAKAHLYEIGTLSQPRGYVPKDGHAVHER